MYNPRITNRSEFKKYCLTRLGAPVQMINVADEQIEDRIDDALDKFWEFHGEGSNLIPLKVELTQEIVDTRIIKVPDGVLSVHRVLMPGSGSSAHLSTNPQYMQFLTEVLDIRRFGSMGNMSGYVQTMSHLGTLNKILNGGEKPVEFNQFRGQIEIQGGFGASKVGDFIIFEVWTVQDPQEFKKTWNNQWLKDYAAALIQKQWGQNLIKFGGAQLPGGIQINGDRILDEAKGEIEKLEEQLYNTWQEPPSFFMA